MVDIKGSISPILLSAPRCSRRHFILHWKYLCNPFAYRLGLYSIRQKDPDLQRLGNSFHDSGDVLCKERKPRPLQ